MKHLLSISFIWVIFLTIGCAQQPAVRPHVENAAFDNKISRTISFTVPVISPEELKKLCGFVQGLNIVKGKSQKSLLPRSIDDNITVYPNPFSRELKLNINSSFIENVTVSFYHVNGQLVSTQEMELIQGQNNLNIRNTDQLLPGLYLVSVMSDNMNFKTKVLKIE